MNKKPVIWIIAGTSEGRALIKALASIQAEIHVSVATEYGATLIEAQDNVIVHQKRMNLTQMQDFIQEHKPVCIIDATHPYAVIVTDTIKKACVSSSSKYIRLLRPASESGQCINVASYQEAVEFLGHVEGNIFLTTGSKTLDLFTAVPNYEERITLRVLPMLDSLNTAINLGYKLSNIICMQGPFSEELNVAMFKKAQAKYVVTKDSGSVGGFEEKKRAAKLAGAELIVIQREEEQSGISFIDVLNEVKSLCTDRVVVEEEN